MVMVRRSSRSMVRLPSTRCTQLASSTMTWATVTGSGPTVDDLNFHHTVRRQPNPLYRELLHRREALAEDADRPDPEEQRHQGREQHQRREPLEPERRRLGGCWTEPDFLVAGRSRSGGAGSSSLDMRSLHQEDHRSSPARRTRFGGRGT